ncbi:protein MTL1-like isoform X1 [Stylophora pistillata]|uniref:protein MTL1-like isoform X1 n=1 Tax=Stylophora pistillata TaxID=50429 RepID=UPI000C04D15D|nr:protein MTL1-like isoform X1 [Stylophora pistillata]
MQSLYGSPTSLSFLSASPILQSSSQISSSSSTASASSSTRSPSSLSSPSASLPSSKSIPTASPFLSMLSSSTSWSLPVILSSSSSSLSPSLSLSSSSSSSSRTFTSPPAPLLTIERVANEYVSKLGTVELSRESSLKEAMRLFNEFTNQYQNITKPIKGQLGKGEVTKGTEAIFKVAVAFEKLVLDYSRYHLNEKKPLKKMYDRRMVLRIKIGYPNDASNFLLEDEERQASINISSANFAENGSVVIGCVYKDLHELLLTNQPIGNGTNNSRYVNTRIMTADMDPKPEKLQ